MRPLITAAALAAILALAGCSTPTTPSGGTGGDGGSGGTNGRPGTSQDDGSSGTDGSDEPSIDDTAPVSGRLPADWPAEVVVPEGEITQAMSLGTSWIALIDVADTATAFASSSASLQAVGYTVVSEVVTDHGSIGVYENAELQVQIAVATAADAGWTMSYTITEKS